MSAIFALGLIFRNLVNCMEGEQLTLELYRSITEALQGTVMGTDVRRALGLLQPLVMGGERPNEKDLTWSGNILHSALLNAQDKLIRAGFEALGARLPMELERIERIRKLEELRAAAEGKEKMERSEKLRSIRLFCRDINSVRQELHHRDGKPGVDLGVSEASSLPDIRVRYRDLLNIVLDEVKPAEKSLQLEKFQLVQEGRRIAQALNAEFGLDQKSPLEHLEVAVATLRGRRVETQQPAKPAAKPAQSKRAPRPKAPEGAKEAAAARFAAVEGTVFAPRQEFHGVLAQMSEDMAAKEERSQRAERAAETRARNREAAKERAAS